MELQQLVIEGMTPPPATRTASPDVRLQGVGAAIRATRLDRRHRQGVVAVRAGITPAYLSRIERGQAMPSLRVLVRLADALDTTASTLLHGANSEGSIPAYPE